MSALSVSRVHKFCERLVSRDDVELQRSSQISRSSRDCNALLLTSHSALTQWQSDNYKFRHVRELFVSKSDLIAQQQCVRFLFLHKRNKVTSDFNIFRFFLFYLQKDILRNLKEKRELAITKRLKERETHIGIKHIKILELSYSKIYISEMV